MCLKSTHRDDGSSTSQRRCGSSVLPTRTACATCSCRTPRRGWRSSRPARDPMTTSSTRSRGCCPATTATVTPHGSPGHGADHVLPALVAPSVTVPVQGGDPVARHLAECRAGRSEPRQPAPVGAVELHRRLSTARQIRPRHVSAVGRSGGMRPRTEEGQQHVQTHEIRKRFLDHFVNGGPHRGAQRLGDPRRPQPAVRQRRHGAVRAVLPRSAHAAVEPRDQHPEMHPHTGHRRGRHHHPAQHVLPDGGQLLVRRLLQEGRHRVRLDAADQPAGPGRLRLRPRKDLGDSLSR